MRSKGILFFDIIVITKGLSHDCNQEIQKMKHHEESWSNPHNIKHSLLRSLSHTVCTDLELSQCNLKNKWNGLQNWLVSNLFQICFIQIIKFDLVLTKQVETNSECKVKDCENDDKPKDVIEDSEHDSHNISNTVNNLHVVKDLSKNYNRI